MGNYIKPFIGILVAAILLLSQPAYAHGVIYETTKLDNNKLRITLKWSNPSEAKGIKITHYYLKNGKTLNIGYEVKQGEDTSAYMDFDLTGAISPIRINLSPINKMDYAIFDDIKGIEAQEYITHLHDAGIVNGREKNNFCPEATITRAEFMALMVKALKLNETVQNTKGFNDIENHWAKDSILLAWKNGLISGYEDNTIKPDNPITVAEVSAVISRAFTFHTEKNGIYAKIKQNMWYSTHIKKMFDTGILNVNDEIYKNFDAKDYINRGDCAMMISRALSTY